MSIEDDTSILFNLIDPSEHMDYDELVRNMKKNIDTIIIDNLTPKEGFLKNIEKNNSKGKKMCEKCYRMENVWRQFDVFDRDGKELAYVRFKDGCDVEVSIRFSVNIDELEIILDAARGIYKRERNENDKS